MSNTNKIGRWGEACALKYLESCGFYLYHSNYRYGRNEIDLIVYQQDLLLFVEVKTRRQIHHGFPESFLSDEQKEHIHLAAQHFLLEHPWPGRIRFDIISIWMKTPLGVEHFMDAF